MFFKVLPVWIWLTCTLICTESLENRQNLTQSLLSVLVEVAAVWPQLPEQIKTAIMALVKSHNV
jgi:hypothetical protein